MSGRRLARWLSSEPLLSEFCCPVVARMTGQHPLLDIGAAASDTGTARGGAAGAAPGLRRSSHRVTSRRVRN